MKHTYVIVLVSSAADVPPQYYDGFEFGALASARVYIGAVDRALATILNIIQEVPVGYIIGVVRV